MLKEKLEQMPRQLRDHWEGKTGQVSVLGRTHEYLIIARDLHPSPKYFASCRADGSTPPFISDEVPPEYRPFLMAHEIYEGNYLAGQPHRCLRALEYELGCVPATKIKAYLRFRLRTIESLLIFIDDPEHRTGYRLNMYGVTKEAHQYLKRLLS